MFKFCIIKYLCYKSSIIQYYCVYLHQKNEI
uniref:Uncharacterized protein n=1 Tax=Siphoviridae sp. ct2wG4 TaxID=2826278 RepID=A0A8S5QW11_9CAUD|nr:MAG TPA: hypothetical protein [Siphoviridae sp. ct2wG4]DAI93681.1 MAG TPA: hypothetical protein [Caudoviricetes sp.]